MGLSVLSEKLLGMMIFGIFESSDTLFHVLRRERNTAFDGDAVFPVIISCELHSGTNIQIPKMLLYNHFGQFCKIKYCR